MQTAKIPKGLLTEIDRYVNKFLWGTTADKRRMHLVAWGKVCCPRSCGGLGLKNLTAMNIAHHMKLGWSLMKEPGKLCNQVFQAKYKVGSVNHSGLVDNSESSPLWRNICSLYPQLLAGMGWSVSNGNLVRFWLDMWVQGVTGPLLSHSILAVPTEQLEYKVSAYVTRGGEWSWDDFRMYLPPETLLKIAATFPPHHSLEADRLCWSLKPSGNFSIRSAYQLLQHPVWASGERIWQLIWKWQGSNRIRTHLWLTAHGRLMTNARRFHLSLTESPVCSDCPTHVESLAHVFRDCWRARQVWNQIVERRRQSGLTRGRYCLVWCFPNFGNGGTNVALTPVRRRPMLCRKYWRMFRTLPWHLTSTVLSPLLLPIVAHRLLRIDLSLNSTLVVSLISSESSPMPNSLVRAIKELISRNWVVRVRHIYRKGQSLSLPSIMLIDEEWGVYVIENGHLYCFMEALILHLEPLVGYLGDGAPSRRSHWDHIV
ncbi:hypothetical protein K2173_000937 [Erythroxylum novogranatense]|uniref:Reverse transcriptase zinc-binding domain-containing protein n=1 Tax=Erythroxylum novogranatense TaxID=1862640 RepID=A0AAV8TQB5_9ROSI|nr:hypothetical protein K2173_000937 [Erythroxylum novogranatense]